MASTSPIRATNKQGGGLANPLANTTRRASSRRPRVPYARLAAGALTLGISAFALGATAVLSPQIALASPGDNDSDGGGNVGGGNIGGGKGGGGNIGGGKGGGGNIGGGNIGGGNIGGGNIGGGGQHPIPSLPSVGAPTDLILLPYPTDTTWWLDDISGPIPPPVIIPPVVVPGLPRGDGPNMTGENGIDQGLGDVSTAVQGTPPPDVYPDPVVPPQPFDPYPDIDPPAIDLDAIAVQPAPPLVGGELPTESSGVASPNMTGEPQGGLIVDIPNMDIIDVYVMQPAPPLVGSEECDRDCDTDGKDHPPQN